MMRLVGAAALALIAGSATGTAHEFWISPETYRLAPGAAILADLNVGDAFDGTAKGFLPDDFVRFEILTEDGAVEVEGRDGDIPALGGPELREGLAVIVHETAARELTWERWDRFAAHAGAKGLGDLSEVEAERGLTAGAPLREQYVRYAKSLVAIGHGEGDDRLVGLRAEFLALANPYTDDLAGAIPVQLHLDGEPCSMNPVKVFARPTGGGEIEVSAFETDGNGIVILPIETGMEYLVTAAMVEPLPEEDPEVAPVADDGVLRTLWASMTFEVPAHDAGP